MLIVADTSPLHYLVLIGAVPVLPRLYGRVFIPAKVLAELTEAETPEAIRQWAHSQPDWLVLREPASAISTTTLDEGEAAAIALALELKADRLLIDERAVRQVAIGLGIQVAGTLAVLRDAALAGLIDLRSSLAQLQETNFRISPDLVDQIIAEFDRQRESH